jgi:hypothetical protein
LKHPQIDPVTQLQTQSPAERLADRQQRHTGQSFFNKFLKRGISGTSISVEPFHLFRYLDEQSFRYNNRLGFNDATRFGLVMSQIVGKRVTYAELTGKEAGAIC